MTEALTLDPTAPRHVITPLALLAAALMIAASIALGFGLRTWTESTSTSSTPTIRVVQPATQPSTPQPLVRMNGPR